MRTHAKIQSYYLCLSKQLKPQEKNYPNHDLELTVLIHTLKTWRHYLYGILFKLMTNHKSLKYIFTQKDLNNIQRRWLEFLANYNVKIDYHEIKANKVGDAFSHHPTKMGDRDIVAMMV